MKKTTQSCNCDYYLTGYHYAWCEDTPIYTQLVKDYGGNPAYSWPHLTAEQKKCK